MKRFWDKVNKTDGCWEWTAAVRGYNKYGAFKLDGKVVSAHRFSYFLFWNKWPEKLILHSCDNRLCVKPSHLREGTYKENTADAMIAGTHYIPSSKPTTHGKPYMYQRYRCRCDLCVKANRDRVRRQRARK